MAHLGRKGQVYMARFRFMGREYKRSLKTTDSRDAKAALHSIELTIHRLITGAIELPEAADPGAFIVSGGKLLTAPQRVKPESIPSVTAAINEYTGSSLGHLAESNRATIRTHLRNLEGHLGAKVDRALDRITLRDLEGFIESRLHKRASSTVQKERMTIVGFFRWARLQTYVPASVAENLRTIKASGDQRPFRTVQEIEVVIERGGLEPEEALELWDCLYLTPEEIKSVLEIVAERGRSDVSLLLHTVPAYTGMRRGEILRLRWSDVEFDQDSLVARSRKQSRQQVETQRRIDMHPELKAFLLDWRTQRPRGQFVACDRNDLDPLTPKEANKRFWQPLVGTFWCLSSHRRLFKIGFHSYRHSFASNLAAAGVDQRVIDEWMGHQSAAMRKRYRHLFPKDRQTAIQCFSFRSQPRTCEPPDFPIDRGGNVVHIEGCRLAGHIAGDPKCVVNG